MGTEVGGLQNAALKRKLRLQEMKDKRSRGDVDSSQKENVSKEATNEKLPRPVFRSYQPIDEKLQDNQLPKVEPGKVEEKIKDQLEAANMQTVVEDVDLINLAPRKPDWDLKRDISKKLAKLERRTQRSIALLIRDRLKGSGQDLLTAVNASDALAQGDQDDDDDDDDDDD